MKFCPDCSNFLYIKDSSDAETGETYLENYCRNCGFSERRSEHKIDTFKIDNEYSIKKINPEELVNDLTYARTRAVECPGDDCPSNTGVTRHEVLYFKQKGKLKLNYICCVCKTMWKN
jgi:DNA-directed RNA polymerase subunit M/transcription elongation factor TFIIS